MDDVIENCQTTFEEDGVNQQTLEDLRRVGLFLSSSQHFSSHGDVVQLPSSRNI